MLVEYSCHRKDQSLSTGGRCTKDPRGVTVSCLLVRPWIDLVRGPAGPTRGERADERGREIDRCSCGVRAGDAKAPVGNEDGGAVEERRGGGGRREETRAGVCTCGCGDDMAPILGSRGMDGKRRLPFKSL